MKNTGISLLEALKKQGGTLEPDQEKFINALDEALKSRESNLEESYSEGLKAALAETLGAIEKDEQGKIVPLATQIKNIAEALDKMEANRTGILEEKQKFELRKYVQDNHAAIVDAVKNNKDLPPFEFKHVTTKAAAMFTTTSAVTNGAGVGLPLVENFLVEEGIAVIRHPENFILDVIPNRRVSKVPQQVIRTEQATEEGAVTVVLEGGTKPLVSDTFVRNTTARAKYAGRIEWTEEFEMDNEMLFNEIVRLFEDKVIRAWQAGIISTIVSNAVAYTSSVLDGTFVAPDNALAVIAGQSVVQGMYFTPTVVLMNPSDIFAAMFTQDTEGNPQVKPYIVNVNGVYYINGMMVFAAYQIPQGTALVGDPSVYQEWHSDFIFRIGTYGTQFIENEKTAIGEIFSLLRIAAIDEPAWMVIDLDAVKEDLTIVTP